MTSRIYLLVFLFEILHHDADFVIDDAGCNRFDFKFDILSAEIEDFTFQLDVLVDLHEFQVCHIHGVDVVVHDVVVIEQCHDHPLDKAHKACLCECTELIRHERQHFHMDGIFFNCDFTIDRFFCGHACLQLMRRNVFEDLPSVDNADQSL